MIVNQDNKIVTKEPKPFHFSFNLPEDVDKNLKHENEFIIKRNESLVEHKIKKDSEQLLFTYKRGNDIHEYRKQ